MSENKTNNTVICDSCGHSARIHPQLADKYVQPMAEIFKVLGDPTRIKILELLSHEDMCVSNIAEMLDMTHSAISHQLRQLRCCLPQRRYRRGIRLFSQVKKRGCDERFSHNPVFFCP